MPNVRWIYFDLPRWGSFWKKGRRGIHVYYCLWQIGAYFLAKRLHQQNPFDLAHHVTLVNYWLPIYLALLPVPLIWGPVGGGESAPPGFWRCCSFRGKAYEFLRHLGRCLGEINPFVRHTARQAAFALATTEETARRLRELGGKMVQICSQVGLPQNEIERLKNFPVLREANTFRVLSVGSFVHFKGFELGLRAFASFYRRFPQSEYWLVGNGREKGRLERLVRRLGLAAQVMFLGELPRGEVLAKLGECDVLLHPTLHDSGGWASLEAMAAGRPVICLDCGGPALQVTAETGIKVAAVSPSQVVTDLAEALVGLASDPERRARLGAMARTRVREHFSWDSKGEDLAAVYSEAVRGTSAKACQDIYGFLRS
jgi:glycosyltransferase involved in cell wall biosynthesis